MLWTPRLAIQHAQPVVTVGLERVHAEFGGQDEGLVVVCCGLRALRGLAPRRNVAEKAQGIRLIATLVRTGEGRAPTPARRGPVPPPGGRPAPAPPPGRDNRMGPGARVGRVSEVTFTFEYGAAARLVRGVYLPVTLMV
jgi:hypothetical protein